MHWLLFLIFFFIKIKTNFRAKLGTGILSGKYSKAPPEDSKDTEQEGISPVMFKNLIGRNSDFATKRQQDAQEFFLHLVNTLEVGQLFS